MEEKISENQSVEISAKSTRPWLKVVLFSISGVILVGGLVVAGVRSGRRQVQPVVQPTPTLMVTPTSTPTPTPEVTPILTPTPTPIVIATPTSDPTANWETYTNTKYEFEFKYPKDWVITESLSKTAANINWLFITLARKENMPPPGTLPHIQIHVVESTERKYFSLYEWTNIVGSITVDGIEAEVRQHKSADEKEVVFIKNGTTFEIISLNYTKDDSQNRIFNLMLSTFRFLE